jgi:hypothetical protein
VRPVVERPAKPPARGSGGPRRRSAPAPKPRPAAPRRSRLGSLRDGRWTLASIGALLGLLLLVSLTAPRWAELLRRPLPDADDDPIPVEEPAPPEPGPSAGGPAERRIRVKLYLGHPEERALVEEEREIPFSADISDQVRTVVEALIEGSQGTLAPVLPEGTKVLDVFVRGGVAYVNLSAQASQEHEGGSVAELVTVYAIVNSVTVNLPAVRHVQLVVGGEGRSSFAGHIDITSPLGPDLSLLAPMPLVPEAETAAAPPTGREGGSS